MTEPLKTGSGYVHLEESDRQYNGDLELYENWVFVSYSGKAFSLKRENVDYIKWMEVDG